MDRGGALSMCQFRTEIGTGGLGTRVGPILRFQRNGGPTPNPNLRTGSLTWGRAKLRRLRSPDHVEPTTYRDGFGSAACIELAIHASQMRANCTARDGQLLGDRII